MVKTKKTEGETEYVTFGGVKLSVLNQDPAYVPASTPDIIMSEKQAAIIGLCIATNMPLLLQGEAGTGKTSVARSIAHKRKQGYTRINMHGAQLEALRGLTQDFKKFQRDNLKPKRVKKDEKMN
jgi:transcriptional regulator of acetoin/glycerol metabolism